MRCEALNCPKRSIDNVTLEQVSVAVVIFYFVNTLFSQNVRLLAVRLHHSECASVGPFIGVFSVYPRQVRGCR